MDDWRETDLYKKNLDEWNDRKVFPFLCSPNLQELPAIIIDEQSDSVADQLHKKTQIITRQKRNKDYASGNFRKIIKKFIHDHSPRSRPYIDGFGTHSLRRTFYLFAKLGGATFEESMRVARHETISKARIYQADAEAIQVCMQDHSPSNRELQSVWKFNFNMFVAGGAQKRRIDALGPGNDVGGMRIDEIAARFVEDMLNVPATHESYMDPNFLMEKALSTNFQKELQHDNPRDSIRHIGLTPSQLKFVSDAMSKNWETCERECYQKWVTDGNTPVVPHNPTSHTQPLNSPQVSVLTDTTIMPPPSSSWQNSTFTPTSPITHLQILHCKSTNGANPQFHFRQSVINTVNQLNFPESVWFAHRLLHEMASIHYLELNRSTGFLMEGNELIEDYDPLDLDSNLIQAQTRHFKQYHPCLREFKQCLVQCHKKSLTGFLTSPDHIRRFTMVTHGAMKRNKSKNTGFHCMKCCST